MRLLIRAFSIFGLSLSAPTPLGRSSMGPPRLLMFGDSLVQSNGTGAALEMMYWRPAAKMRVDNYGFGGYTSQWALLAARRFLAAERDVKLMGVWLGTNDAAFMGTPRHVELEQFKANLRAIYDLRPKDSDGKSCSVLFITPKPISVALRAKFEAAGGYPLDAAHIDMRSYAEAVVDVAKELKSPVVELYEGMLAEAKERGSGDVEAGLADFLIDDGVHLSPAGYDFVTERVIAALAANRFAPSDLPDWMPEQDSIDLEHPEAAFDYLSTVLCPRAGAPGVVQVRGIDRCPAADV